MIDDIYDTCKGIHVSLMSNEVGILKDAVDTIIQWLLITIVLTKVHLHYCLLFYLLYTRELELGEFFIFKPLFNIKISYLG